MKVKLEHDAFRPERAHDTDAGYDLRACRGKKIDAYESKVFDTGVHVQIPHGYCGIIVSKSGLNVNQNITSTGLIDEGYTGTIKVKLYNHGESEYCVKRGDKISQLVIVPYLAEEIELVDRLDETERGDRGFGSTGK